jgi:hypothetical protein
MASSSKFADEGSIAHILASMCLTEEKDAAAYIGRIIEAHDYEHAKLSPSGAGKWMECFGSPAREAEAEGPFVPRSYSLEVTEEMAMHVQVYLDMVRARVESCWLMGATNVELRVEQTLQIDHLTGEGEWRDELGNVLSTEPDFQCDVPADERAHCTWFPATGTGDVLIIATFEDGTALLIFIDLKFGRGVEVEVVGNKQELMYASGAVRELELAYNIKNICLVIHQPRIKREPSDWEITIEELREFEAKCQSAVRQVRQARAQFAVLPNDTTYLVPGDHCSNYFCKARATCPALQAFAQRHVGADFETVIEIGTTPFDPSDTSVFEPDSPSLGAAMDAAPIVEDFFREVRAEVERRLLAGKPVPSPKGGYKLVPGKKGNRQFDDEAAVEEVLKAARLKKEITHVSKLKTPTQLEKVIAEEKPKVWAKLAEHITQAEGGKSVAPMSDKRPAIEVAPAVDDFASVETTDTSADDLAG